MNTDKELMQQALEALKFYYDQHGEESDAKVIIALRERLAQPEQEPIAWRYDLKRGGSFAGVSTEYSPVKLSIGENWTPLYTSPPQRERLAQPEQEPFGYFRYDLRLDAWVQNREGRLGTPFYAAPPQRKPLPPQSPCEMTQAEGKMFKLGWLECEAAHGIGEKPDAA